MRRLLLHTAGTAAICLLAPLAGLRAQVAAVSPQAVVESRQAAYEEAKAKSEAARLAAARVRDEWSQLLEQHAAASRANDRDSVRELLAVFKERSPEKSRLEQAWRSSQELWKEAGQELVVAIDDYLERLWPTTEQSVGAAEYENALYNELLSTLRRVESELPEVPLELEPMPEVTIRPGDTPGEILYKARLMENRVRYYASLVAELDQKIEALAQRQRREQNRRDFMTSRERFGDDVVPIGNRRPELSDPASEAPRVPIEVRIEQHRELRGEVEMRMLELSRKAEEFRGRAGGGQ
ncbi:MAG: hypothetical protein J4F34_03570 [Gemmatimonadetes bacterium]|nr:hypothetical protein [Gemmatimonadota bacterium]